MSVICGWASQSENRTANGKKGDQTGNEVKIGKYYNFGQNEIIRFINANKGRNAGKAIKKLCLNDNIGYGQTDRKSLYDECVKINWNIKKIDKIGKCNADCSMLCLCAINFAYGKALISAYTNTSLFHNRTVKEHPMMFKSVGISSKKKAGDMPIRAGHHIIMCIEDE